MVDLGFGRKPWVIISNNQRNKALDDVLAARITTTPKANLPTAVKLPVGEVVTGWILTDHISLLYTDELTAPIGALPPQVMRQLSDALRIAIP